VAESEPRQGLFQASHRLVGATAGVEILVPCAAEGEHNGPIAPGFLVRGGEKAVHPVLARAEVEAEHVPKEWPDEPLPAESGIVAPALGAFVDSPETSVGEIGIPVRKPAPPPASRTQTEHASQVVVREEAPDVAQVAERHACTPSGTRNSAAKGRGGSGGFT